jgi:hypothetical protein
MVFPCPEIENTPVISVKSLFNSSLTVAMNRAKLARQHVVVLPLLLSSLLFSYIVFPGCLKDPATLKSLPATTFRPIAIFNSHLT